MFLALTSDKKYWSTKHGEIVLLGDWCEKNLDFEERNKYKIIDYHWIEHSKIIESQKYLYNLYVKTIKCLSVKLNLYHNLNLDEKYWEYLIGNWLWIYLQNLYDRYLSLIEVKKKYPNINVRINKRKIVINSLSELYTIIHDDDYNYYLYSRIIINSNINFNLDIIDSDYINIINERKKYINYTNKKKINLNFIKIVRKLINYFKEFFGSKYNFYLDLNSALSFEQKKSIYKKLNQILYIPSILLDNFNVFFNKYLSNLEIDKKNRNQLIDLKYENEFELIVNKIIFYDLPKDYLEHYIYIRKLIKKKLPSKIPKFILIRGYAEMDPILRFLISEFYLKKSIIISCQEGGGIGAKKLSVYSEKIFSRFYDILLNWGWSTNLKKIKRFYFTKTFWINNYKYKKNGNLLLIGSSCRRYFLDHSSGQLPFYNKIHLNLNINFLSKINKNIFNDLIYRLHWKHGYRENEILLKKFPNLHLSFREKEPHFYNLLNNSRINLCTTDFTTYKQSFIVNHPTVLLWDKEYFQFRNSASFYFDLLNKVKILHYDPIDCANFINKIYNDPKSWWLKEEVQNAKNIFIKEFCNTDENIDNEFVKFITNYNEHDFN